MKKLWKENSVILVAIFCLCAIILLIVGASITRADMPVDHSIHEYDLLLTTGEHLTVQFEKCEMEIFWSSMYAVCGTNGVDGVNETWRAAIVAMEEK